VADETARTLLKNAARMTEVRLRTSVATMSGEPVITHSVNSVMYCAARHANQHQGGGQARHTSVSVIPGQWLPGERSGQPAPPVMRKSATVRVGVERADSQ
jgi:hypothetical protein